MTPYRDILIKDALEKVFPDQLPISVLQRQTPPDLIQLQAWFKCTVFQNISISSAGPSSCLLAAPEDVPLCMTVCASWYKCSYNMSPDAHSVSGRHCREICFLKRDGTNTRCTTSNFLHEHGASQNCWGLSLALCLQGTCSNVPPLTGSSARHIKMLWTETAALVELQWATSNSNYMMSG